MGKTLAAFVSSILLWMYATRQPMQYACPCALSPTCMPNWTRFDEVADSAAANGFAVRWHGSKQIRHVVRLSTTVVGVAGALPLPLASTGVPGRRAFSARTNSCAGYGNGLRRGWGWTGA